jgi:GNAT superfamily N-acetyltransferase
MHSVEELPAPSAHDLRELGELLVDSVAGGASVNFIDVPTLESAQEWWRAATSDADNYLFVARSHNGRIIGCVRLMPAPQPNGVHRADVGKLLVHSEFRNRGVASDLMTVLEKSALAMGRTLLVLDTETGSPAESFYRSHGWVQFGHLADHSFSTKGTLSSTTYFAKRL